MRRSIAEVVSVRGVGLHSGTPCMVTLRANDGAGWLINGHSLRDASISSGNLPTELQFGGSKLSTVEHLFAALYAHEIDDVSIEVDGPEVPILDGSAEQWYTAIRPETTRGNPDILCPQEVIEINEGEAHISLYPADHFSARMQVEFEGYPTESFEGDFGRFPLAMAARTFGYVEHLPHLHKQGLALGAHPQNVLGLSYTGCAVLDQPKKQKDELARHKWLDLIGDIALLGMRLHARIDAVKSGHSSHHQLVEKLRELSM